MISQTNMHDDNIQKPLDEYSAVLDLIPSPLCMTSNDCSLSMLCYNRNFEKLVSEIPKQLREWLANEDISKMFQALETQDSFELSGNDVSHKMYYQFTVKPYQDVLLWDVRNQTNEREVRSAYKQLYQEHELIMRESGRAYSVYQIPQKTLIFSEEVAADFGLPMICENVPFSIAEKLFQEEDSIRRYYEFYQDIADGLPNCSIVVKMGNSCHEGEWYVLNSTTIYDDEGNPQRCVISHENVTMKREKEILYQKWQNRFERAKKNAIAYYEYDLTDDSFELMVGPLCDRNYIEPTFSQVTEYIVNHEIYSEDQNAYRELFNRGSLLSGFYEGITEHQFEHRRIKADGTKYWVKASIQIVQDPYSDHIKASMLLKDIDEKKSEQLMLERLSSRDSLTGLYNRHEMIKRIESIIQQYPKETHLLLVMDLDCFKQINDTQGHVFGDKVLCDVASRMNTLIRDDDLCGRLGGDEFIALLKDVRSQACLEERLEDLCRNLNFQYPELETTISIGVAVYPNHGLDFQTLYQHGDQALYEAKHKGRNGYAIYHEAS